MAMMAMTTNNSIKVNPDPVVESGAGFDFRDIGKFCFFIFGH
jgi:hypothetical protein